MASGPGHVCVHGFNVMINALTYNYKVFLTGPLTTVAAYAGDNCSSAQPLRPEVSNTVLSSPACSVNCSLRTR